jgi:superfamily II DNA helicase RecQ
VDLFESSSQTPAGPAGKSRVDYKQVLSPDEFQMFAQLRDLRKTLAQDEAVPAYTIFTNDQLAEMVRNRVASLADLERVTGVGNARVARYGERVLAILCPRNMLQGDRPAETSAS